MDELREQYEAKLAEAEGILDAAAAETRGLNDDEAAKHDELVNEARSLRLLLQQREQIAREREEILPQVRAAVEGTREERAADAPAPTAPRVEVGEMRDPVYHERSEHSFFVDKVRAGAQGDHEAMQRLNQMRAFNEQELKKRDLYDNATDGAEALVPIYLQDRFEQYRTNIAVAANLTNRQALPALGDSITVPYQTGAASVAALTQATPLTAISETDAQFTTDSVNVVEVAGVQDISLLLVERGTLGVGLDVVIGNHLAELLAQDEDQRVLAEVDSEAGVAVTYTATTGTLAEIYAKLADAAQQIISGNKVPPNAILCHERRFFKWAAELDENNRPLMVPMSVAQNPLAVGGGEIKPAGFTGYAIHGIPVYIDSNVTTTNGAGTNEDIVYVCDWKQQYTWSSPVMVEFDRSPMFKNSGLTVRARRYMATMAGHRDDAFGRITGTGLATPSF
jgi:hypothetical protein